MGNDCMGEVRMRNVCIGDLDTACDCVLMVRCLLVCVGDVYIYVAAL
jgi:hypothetical protein